MITGLLFRLWTVTSYDSPAYRSRTYDSKLGIFIISWLLFDPQSPQQIVSRHLEISRL